MKRKNIFLLIGVFWLIIIIGFVTYQEFTLKTGQDVLLKVQPVDPRDLFRGDYVVLRYDITRVNSDTQLSNGERVYAQLEINKEGYGEVSQLSTTKPEGLFIRGKVYRKWKEGVYDINYGIESYFVPEGKGLQLERQLNDIDVKVSIDKYGRAIIKSMLIEDEPFEFVEEDKD